MMITTVLERLSQRKIDVCVTWATCQILNETVQTNPRRVSNAPFADALLQLPVTARLSICSTWTASNVTGV